MTQTLLTRRSLLSRSALALTASHAFSATVEASPIAEATHGRLRGSSVRGVHIFRGIPYGGTVEGAGRFLPPGKAAKWRGIRDATVTPARCVQGEGNIFTSTVIGDYWAGGRTDRLSLSAQTDSENCLFLNVLTPSLRGKRAVMVYIHGGGFTNGSSILSLFGDGLVRDQDVVLVGVNHRINVFGYTYLGGLSEKYAMGNAGQLDLIAALEWIRDNIGHFGGDPGKVMIFGESGGGAKISALLAMPAAKGLYHRASIQSGSALTATTAEAATENARKLLAHFSLTEKEIDKLQTIPAQELFAAARKENALGVGAVVDGHSIPVQTWDPKAPEPSAGVPLLIGHDKDESTLFSLRDDSLFHLDDAVLRERLVKAGLPAAELDPLLAAYRRDYPNDSASDLYFRISTDRGARRNARIQAERKIAQGRGAVYVWYCQWNTPLGMEGRPIKCFHTCDLPLTMRLVRYPDAENLSRQLSAAWATFARTGSPSTAALPWPAYTVERRTTMVFDGPKSEAIDDPGREERVLLENRPSGSLL